MVDHSGRKLWIGIKHFDIDQARARHGSDLNPLMEDFKQPHTAMRRVLQRAIGWVGGPFRREETEHHTDGIKPGPIVLGLLQVKVFNHPKGQRVGLKNLGLGLDNHVDLERIRRCVGPGRLNAKRAVGIFLHLDFADRSITPGRKCEGERSQQHASRHAQIDDFAAARQHGAHLTQGELGGDAHSDLRTGHR